MKKAAPVCVFEKKFPSELSRGEDGYFMSLAYNLALDAWRAGEVPVGCVIAKDGVVVGAAHNGVEEGKDATAHAEVLAIGQAAARLGDWRLEGCELFVTKEPCPMCSGAVLLSRLKRVCFAAGDEKMGCLGGATNLNELAGMNHRVEVSKGVMEEECLGMLREFFRLRREASEQG